MSTDLTADGETFEVTLKQLVSTRVEGEEVTVLLFDAYNKSDEMTQLWYDEFRFIDADGYQHTAWDTNGLGSPEVDIDADTEIHESPEVVPGARARVMTFLQLPDSRQLERIFYSYGDEKFELTPEPETIDDLTVLGPEVGLNHPTDETFSEEPSEATDAEDQLTATSENFEATLEYIIEDAGGGDVTLLTFEVENIGTTTEQWWYDEHTFVDEEGYQLNEVGAVEGGIITDAEVSIRGYEPSPEIQPGATAKCITDVSPEDGKRLQAIHYDFSSDDYEISLDEEMLEEVTISYDDLEEHGLEVGDEEEDDEGIDERVSAMVVDESPDTTYDDIGGLSEQKRKVQEAIREPLISPEQFDEIGITPPEGVLLHGPPGTGKTMLAKAVANDADATFIKLAGPELARAYLGEGAELVRDCFEYARRKRPSIIFIDEIDAIAARRQSGASEGTEEVYRTMLQLLSEMDGFEEQEDVRVMAATNRINRLDDAILRPGRFDRIIEVPQPGTDGRQQIFEVHTEGLQTADDIDVTMLAERSDEMSGAEVAAICTEAGYAAIRESRDEIRQVDFLTALQEIQQEKVQADEEPDRFQ